MSLSSDTFPCLMPGPSALNVLEVYSAHTSQSDEFIWKGTKLEEPEGYADYKKKVRRGFIPFVW